jgi:hypothetical protein
MFHRIYLIFGLLITAALAFANNTGWVLWDSVSTGNWRHHSGAGGFHAK